MALVMVHIGAVAHLDGGLEVFWSFNHDDRDHDFQRHKDEWDKAFPTRKKFMPGGRLDVFVPMEWSEHKVRREIKKQTERGLDFESDLRRQIIHMVLGGKFHLQDFFSEKANQISVFIMMLTNMAMSETFAQRAIAEGETEKDGMMAMFAEMSMNTEGCGDPACPFCQGKRELTRH